MRAKDAPPKSSPTIRDIAGLAQVSPSTVSRVLNANARVSLAKRGAVLAAIEHSKYRPSIVAQWLARGKARAFGILTQDLGSELFGQVLKGVQEGLHGSGYTPIFAGAWQGEELAGAARGDEPEALELLLRSRVDALIAVGRFPEEPLQKVAGEIPFLSIGPTISGIEHRCVSIENSAGAYAATRHLTDLGHRRIVHIAGPAHHRHSAERLDGFERALADARCKVDARLVVAGDFGEDSGARIVEDLLGRRLSFTAVFTANDLMAFGAMQTLFRRSIRVPRDVSVVGFDDRPHAAHTTPGLTTVRQPMAEMGTAAVLALLRELRGEPLSLPRFSMPLIVRESTAKPPVAPPRWTKGRRS